MVGIAAGAGSLLGRALVEQQLTTPLVLKALGFGAFTTLIVLAGRRRRPAPDRR